MKTTKKVISLILALSLVVGMFSVAVFSAGAAENDNPYSVAAMALDSEYAYDGELGAIYTPEATTFKVWAPLATEVQLNRYATGSDREEGHRDLGVIEMEKLYDGSDWTGVWTTTVSGDIVNTYYTYTITNPNHIYEATSEVSHETQDVYSYAVGVNGDRSMVVNLKSDKTNPEGWDQDTHVFTDEQTDAIVWEVQVKDFSYNPNSGVDPAYRGKFMAFTQTGTTLDGEGTVSTCIDYLKQLGVTYVQINPFYDFATINEAGDDSQFNWGYDPKNYGVPEGSYSTNPYDGNVRIKEAKAMIKALHDAGIGVIMDVVYNHTYSVDSCFNYSVPEYYYRMTAAGGYSQQSGCGNDTASERAMYRKYMRDMLRYWTEEYHIDGYRFDLMGVHDGETMTLIREDMDSIDSRIVMFGEGWAGDTVYDPQTCTGTDTYMTTQVNAAKLPSRVGFFNDEIRDGLKGNVFHAEQGGFINSEMTSASAVSLGIRANTVGKGRWTALTPEQCVTYASCHDNYTLYDKLVFVNHGPASDYRARYNDCIAQNKLTSAIINSSQGIDFLLAGEEMGRSKDGDENSYKSAATLNMIDWSLVKTNADLVSYYKGMFELRKAFSPFTANDTQKNGAPYKYFFDTGIASSLYTIAYTVQNDVEGEWNKIAVIYNGKDTDVTYTFKGKVDRSINADTEWVIVANDKQAGVTSLGEVKGLSFDVPASSAVIAVEKSTFEECAIQSDLAKVIVNSIYGKTGEVLSSNVILGTTGTGYSLSPDTSVPIDYELDHIEGDVEGVFSEEPQVVNFFYTDYIPTPFRAPYGDVDGNGEVDIIDATFLQRHICEFITLDDDHLACGDYDCNGEVDIADVTMLQRWLAGYVKAVNTITARHMTRDVDTGKTKALANADVTRVRYGEPYTTSQKRIAYYTLDAMPANANGISLYDDKVDYFYSYSVAAPVMHVKHSGSETWAPSLWAWAYDENGTAINCYDDYGWPGKPLTKSEDAEWYDVTFPIPGGLNYYFIISKNGNPQTKDYGVVDGQNIGISYDEYPEIWVVINDDEYDTSADGDWCTFYNYNPDLEN